MIIRIISLALTNIILVTQKNLYGIFPLFAEQRGGIKGGEFMKAK
jgi:hypothetical protein